MEHLGKVLDNLMSRERLSGASRHEESMPYACPRHEPGDKQLLDWQRLPPTVALQDTQARQTERLNVARSNDDHRHVRILSNELARTERMLELAARRDAVLAQRPDGCWCLGTGGRREITVATSEGKMLCYLETCTCLEGQYEAEQRDILLPQHTQYIRELEQQGLWERSGLSPWMQEFRLAGWPSIQEYPHVIACLVPIPHKSLFLSGPVGTGKTGLAVGYAWEALHGGLHSLRFVTVPALLGQLRDTYNHPSHDDTPSEGQIIARYALPDLLILDDLGAEQVKGTGWVEDRLYQVIGQRHDERRATVFTSNYGLEGLGNRLGERIVWRIREMVGDDGMIDLTGCPNLREVA